MALEVTGELVPHSLESYIENKVAALAVVRMRMQQQADVAFAQAQSLAFDTMAKLADAKKALSRQREEFENDRKSLLNSLMGRLDRLSCSVKEVSELSAEEIEEIEAMADAIFDSDQADFYALTKLNICSPLQQLLATDTDKLFELAPSIEAQDFKLKLVHRNPENDAQNPNESESSLWILVSLRNHAGLELRSISSLFLPYLELRQTFQTKNVKARISFEELHAAKELTFPKPNVMAMCCSLDKIEAEDVIFSVAFHNKEICDSPTAMSVRSNESFRVDKLPEILQKMKDEELTNPEARGDEVDEEKVVEELEKVGNANVSKALLRIERVAGYVASNPSSHLMNGSNQPMGNGDATDLEAQENNAQAKHWQTLHSNFSKTIADRVGKDDELDASDLNAISFRNSPLKVKEQLVKQIPLDHPSPLNNVMSRTKAAVHSPKTFAPDQASTMGVDAIRSITSDILSQGDEDNDGNYNEENGNVNLSQMQDELVGDVANLNVSRRGQAINKNVSFHEATSVYYQMSAKSNRSKRRTSNNGSSEEFIGYSDSPVKYRYEVAVGRTKEADGSQQLFKDLLRAQKQAVDADRSVTSEVTCQDEDFCFSDVMSDVTAAQVEAEESNWDRDLGSDVQLEAKENFDFDLKNRNISFGLVHALKVPGVPQSVSVMSVDEVVLVSDVQNNTILSYKTGLKLQRGPWAREVNFHVPRYVMCTTTPSSQVFILDNKALYFFPKKTKRPTKLFVNQTSNMRGLAWFETQGRPVTCIVENGSDIEEKGVYVAFIDVYTTKGIVHKIRLPIDISDVDASKVRFLTCNRTHVFCSDLGLGRIYCVDVAENTAHTWADDNRLSTGVIMGLACDPAGNVLVASNADGLMHVFSSTGRFIRSLRLPNLTAPAGIALEGRSLFVADCKEKQLLVYNVVQLGN